jgi:hypothetical protein
MLVTCDFDRQPWQHQQRGSACSSFTAIGTTRSHKASPLWRAIRVPHRVSRGRGRAPTIRRCCGMLQSSGLTAPRVARCRAATASSVSAHFTSAGPFPEVCKARLPTNAERLVFCTTCRLKALWYLRHYTLIMRALSVGITNLRKTCLRLQAHTRRQGVPSQYPMGEHRRRPASCVHCCHVPERRPGRFL